jgi:hypothetical protein
MQMLTAVGIPPVTDHARPADQSNPRGYFETERVKTLGRDAEWLAELKGRCIKIVIPLLPFLPAGLPAKVLVVWRELSEVVASQQQMLQALNAPGSVDPPALEAFFRRQYADVMADIRQRTGVEVLEVQHAKLVGGDAREIEKIVHFLELGADQAEVMAGCIDTRLYRQQRDRLRPSGPGSARLPTSRT